MYFGYIGIDKYNQSNWNYLLLINVLNQVKHSDLFKNMRKIINYGNMSLLKKFGINICIIEENIHDFD